MLGGGGGAEGGGTRGTVRVNLLLCENNHFKALRQ